MRMVGLAALFIALLPLEMLATKPAVKATNGYLFGSYFYEELDRDTQIVGDFEYLNPGSESSGWTVGGVLSFPILNWLGGSLELSGGESSFDTIGEPDFSVTDSTVDQRGVGTRATLIIRDPEFGYVGVGYGFEWNDLPNSDVRVDTHSGRFIAGLFFPDLGLGPVDWGLSFQYGRNSVEVSSPGLPTVYDPIDDFRAAGNIGWYLANTVRLSGGVIWRRQIPDLLETKHSLSGFVEITWLLPPGDHRYIAATIYGVFGSVETEAPEISTVFNQDISSVGFILIFHYPGASSLLELFREY